MTHQPPSTAAFLWKRGDTGPAVADIRSRLIALGLLPGGTDGVPPPPLVREDEPFDAAMEQAVRHFQQERSLTADGVVGPETFRHLDEARWALGDRLLTHSVSHPMVGDDIAQLQQRLLDMGFVPGPVDGIYGAETARAVQEFQRNTGLLPDGTCGPGTFTVLARLARTVVGGHPQVMRETEQLRHSGPSLAGKVLVIDPGHGGGDPGAEANGLREADLMWELAARLEGRLAALGVRTFLTRGSEAKEDRGETERADFANSTDADLFISLHTDSHPNPRAHGVSAYYFGYDRYGRWSHTGRSFADLARREIVARCGLGDNRSHGKTWTLLRSTRMPAVRLDVGHLTHPEDAKRLASPEFQALIVEAVAVALQRLYLPPEDDAPTGVLRLPLITEE